eukprot:m.20273 g.20273  ORF g.20273 m.20273 type:complete len:327 (-) comp10173_c0_seq1:115-1095(-)
MPDMGSFRVVGAVLFVVISTAVVADAKCVQFWAGLCPGNADCMCTTGAACVATEANTSSPEWIAAGAKGCAGSCRKVEHDKCTGSTTCLFDVGPCSGPAPPPPPPPPPHPGPPPPGGEPFGPDVSSYQGDVNWKDVKAARAGFGIVKATEGLSVKDAYFSKNWAGMREAGIAARGAYHFGHPGESATAQADTFTRTVGKVSSGEFYVLDIETATSKARGNLTALADVASWSADFVKAVMSSQGVPPRKVWVYTGAWFWDPNAGGSSALSAHPLWVSGYSAEPPMPKGWDSWTMWQYTDKGSISGVSGASDMSKFHGSQTSLQLLVA